MPSEGLSSDVYQSLIIISIALACRMFRLPDYCFRAGGLLPACDDIPYESSSMDDYVFGFREISSWASVSSSLFSR